MTSDRQRLLPMEEDLLLTTNSLPKREAAPLARIDEAIARRTELKLRMARD